MSASWYEIYEHFESFINLVSNNNEFKVQFHKFLFSTSNNHEFID